MIDFLWTHWLEILAMLTALVTFAERLARLTPTQSDDRLVAALRRLLQLLAVDVPDRQGQSAARKPSPGDAA